MAWRLEIHHIDVQLTGDATLVIAREVPPLAGAVARVQSALIDGGRAQNAAALHLYIGAQLGAGHTLDVMISTHYDADHLNGLTRLLLRPVLYNTTRIYDQGWPGGGLDPIYIAYIRAINGMNNNGPVPILAGVARNRVTNAVLSDGAAPLIPLVAAVGAPAVPAMGAGAINLAANWLLVPGGGAPADLLWPPGAPIPPAAPTIECVAVNRFVRAVPGGAIAGPIGGLAVDPRNEKSLAVVVTFNNFRYYVGGDIETAQENAIQILVNQADDTAGRVLAMKTSHHGANTATSRAFVDQLRPEAAFISCGTANQYNHPAQETINILDGFPANPVGGVPVPAHPPVPPAPPNRPVDHYLTGYQVVAPLGSLGGDNSFTAGDPNPAAVIPGHIRVSVSTLQSLNNVQGRLFLGVQAAVNGAGAAPAAATAAAEQAMSSGPAQAAHAVLSSTGAPLAAQVNVVGAATAAINAGATAAATATLVTAVALGPGTPPGPAAAAGAAAGAAVGGGDGLSIHAAVQAALVQAGVAAVPAAAAAAAAALLAAPGLGLFDVNLHDVNAMVNPQNITHV